MGIENMSDKIDEFVFNRLLSKINFCDARSTHITMHYKADDESLMSEHIEDALREHCGNQASNYSI